MSIRRDLARVMREYQVSEVTVRRYRDTILPKAKEALETMQEAQAAGEFDFLRVLTARRAYFDVNFKYVAALRRLAQANSKTFVNTWGTLDQNGRGQAALQLPELRIPALEGLTLNHAAVILRAGTLHAASAATPLTFTR